ncbi:MAG: YbhB/YbcL family Raf kinase inhibitor-like protein [Syntrophobacterales bacterium]|nr:YbhB/YbcL family Raf kinase inhibitor-like protein [Syntrophobacterales bacterium]
MQRSVAWWCVVGLILTLTAVCGAGGQLMQITSSAFQDGGKIPLQFVMPGAGGKNVSVPLSWSTPPAGTKSLALAMVDPHPVAHNWVHWLVIDLPQDAASLPQGASGRSMPQGAVELKNSFGKVGYGGPQPPPGSGDHPYVFTLYALSVPKVEVSQNTNLAGFKQALEGKILATATITGYFGR